MADTTTNLGLAKPCDNETADIQVINKNMDKIDAVVIAKLLEAKGYTDDKIAQLVNSAPETMNTLKELADAMGDDPNFRTTILNMISDKANSLDLTSLLQDYITHKAEFATLQNKVDNLNTNDAVARNEIMDIKLKLKEQQAINFLNKTGVGFYDTFEDNTNIDTENTTATYDGINKLVDFPYETYITKATADYSNLAVINVDKQVTVGDKMDNLNAILGCVLKDNNTTYDRTTLVSVVNSAFVTSATARPQVLSNGWIVTCVYDNANLALRFYASKDNGSTSALLCSWSVNANAGFSICSKGTILYAIASPSPGTNVYFLKVDALTVSNISMLNNTAVIDSGQTAFGLGCSIAVSSTGELTASWNSKNTTYSNSNNIRSAKSVDGGVAWTKQDGTSGIDQITWTNNTNQNSITPYVQYDNNDMAHIIYNMQDTSTNYIKIIIANFNNAWSLKLLYVDPDGLTQSNPTSTLQKYGVSAGRIWVVWHGTDITDATKNNIRVSYSDDDGITWSSMQKLTSGNTYTEYMPSITTDKNGNVYITFSGGTTTNPSTVNIRQIVWNGSDWGAITEITAQNVSNMYYVTTCDNYYDFTNPITIWQDNLNSRVAFYGEWTVATTTYDITLTNPVTVTNGQELTIYPSPRNLKMVDETFDTFNSLELNLYTDKINKATIKGAVNNSTTVVTGVTDKVITAGDKLFMNSVLNEILNCTGNFVTNTVTDATVVGSAYDTSGNGGRKLVRLSNGWLVSSLVDTTGTKTRFIVSKDNSQTWQELCYIGQNFTAGIALCSYGTTVYSVGTMTSNTIFYAFKFDATTITDIGLIGTQIDTGQTSFGTGCSLAINPQGTELHACWSSKIILMQIVIILDMLKEL
ncbi:hypothetical protein [Clostridium thailandense]|uniref:hypothetical protein n=1 Tax=Clostridium thailandense TaxID=2794346 RepID=UPI0039897C1C